MTLNYVIKHNYFNNSIQVKFVATDYNLNIHTNNSIIYKSLSNKFMAEKLNKYGMNFCMYYAYAAMQYRLILSTIAKKLNDKINNSIANLYR